jgi:putative transposase
VPFADLVKRDFTAPAPNVKWVGDMTEIPTDEGKLYLSTAIDLFSRRLLGYATSAHPDAELAGETIKMAVAARGGKERVVGVVFHSDRGSTYTAHTFTVLCDKLDIRQSMGRTGSCFDNAAAESFFSTLEHEVLSRHHFRTRDEARRVIVKWVVDFYNRRRRHSSCGMQSPIDYETAAANRAA